MNMHHLKMEALRWVALHCIGIVEKISMFSEQCLPNLIWAYATLNKAYLSLFEDGIEVRGRIKHNRLFLSREEPVATLSKLIPT